MGKFAGIAFVFLMVAVSACSQRSFVAVEQPGWSEPSNGLSAKLVFELGLPLTCMTPVIPKIWLRNHSDTPIRMLWCSPSLGSFTVESPEREAIERAPIALGSRSGNVDLVVINPDETVEVDACDFGYLNVVCDLMRGYNQDPRQFVISTTRFKGVMDEGEYLVGFRLVFDEAMLENSRRFWEWKVGDWSSLWVGEIDLTDVPLRLPPAGLQGVGDSE